MGVPTIPCTKHVPFLFAKFNLIYVKGYSVYAIFLFVYYLRLDIGDNVRGIHVLAPLNVYDL